MLVLSKTDIELVQSLIGDIPARYSEYLVRFLNIRLLEQQKEKNPDQGDAVQ